MATGTPDTTEVEYPESDGQPMAETPVHVEAIMLLHQALEDALGPPWFVASDIFWYWEEGDRDTKVAPDVMVVPEVGRTDRRSFKSWVEARQPVAVFEIASDGTWREDFGKKYDLYEFLGVPEYFIFDPEGRFVRPRLQGFRLQDGVYRRIPMDAADGSLVSRELGLVLRPDGPLLRLLARNNELVPTRAERAQREQLRAERAESEVERLKELLKKHGLANGTGE